MKGEGGQSAGEDVRVIGLLLWGSPQRMGVYQSFTQIPSAAEKYSPCTCQSSCVSSLDGQILRIKRKG